MWGGGAARGSLYRASKAVARPGQVAVRRAVRGALMASGVATRRRERRCGTAGCDGSGRTACRGKVSTWRGRALCGHRNDGASGEGGAPAAGGTAYGVATRCACVRRGARGVQARTAHGESSCGELLQPRAGGRGRGRGVRVWRRRAAGGASTWSHSLTPSMVSSFLPGFSGARFGAVACRHTNSSAASSTWSASSCSA